MCVVSGTGSEVNTVYCVYNFLINFMIAGH